MATAKACPWGIFEYELMMFQRTTPPLNLVVAPQDIVPIVSNALVESITWGRSIELAITRDELASTDWAFFDIATRHMKLTLKDSAVMARYGRSVPVGLFFAIANTRNISPLEFEGRNFLGSDDFLGPALNHRHAPVENSLWFGHERPLVGHCSRQFGRFLAALLRSRRCRINLFDSFTR
jgi:hypothetical protein